MTRFSFEQCQHFLYIHGFIILYSDSITFNSKQFSRDILKFMQRMFHISAGAFYSNSSKITFLWFVRGLEKGGMSNSLGYDSYGRTEISPRAVIYLRFVPSEEKGRYSLCPKSLLF